jgi:O-succinylbenzoic acid--CoA ligase
MDHWKGYPVTAMRMEAHFGDRLTRCFAERPHDMHAMFEGAVSRHGSGEALVFEGRRWTWLELDSEVARVAAGLAALGVARGERVVLFLGNLPEFVFALYALQRLGAIAVPVSVREQKPGLEFILNQCGAMLIMHEVALADRVPDGQACPGLRARVAVGESGNFADLLDHGTIDAATVAIADQTTLLCDASPEQMARFESAAHDAGHASRGGREVLVDDGDDAVLAEVGVIVVDGLHPEGAGDREAVARLARRIALVAGQPAP